jgi:hypothetical protein
MRIAVLVVAAMFPGTSPAQGDAWTLTLLERYASWVRAGGFACPMATRITEVRPDDGGTAFKVICGPVGSPVTGEEAAYRLELRPNDTRLVKPWQE